MSTSKVSVIVPIRNEEEYIAKCLESLCEQSYPSDSYEIIVVDGRSSDRSKKIVESLCSEHRNLRCLDNPAAIAPSAMNIGIRNARGEIIIRADGHNYYPGDYVENCVRYLEKTGADNVGGPWLTVPANESFSARLVVSILTSPFGVGNSKYRTSRDEGFVDTVPFGAFRREVFERVGMFNEELVRNQDNDFNARIRQAGGRIYQTPALTTHYHPVKTFSALLAYAFKTSRWHIFTVRQNRHSMGFRHIAPAGFLILLVALFLATFFIPYAITSLGFMLGIYLVTGYYFSARARKGSKLDVTFALPLATFCFHVAYGAGTLSGLCYLFRKPTVSPIRPGLPIEE